MNYLQAIVPRDEAKGGPENRGDKSACNILSISCLLELHRSRGDSDARAENLFITTTLPASGAGRTSDRAALRKFVLETGTTVYRSPYVFIGNVLGRYVCPEEGGAQEKITT